MNKKAFTLIELLAVIVLLSIIALITTVSIRSVLSESKEALSETQKRSIEHSAQDFYVKEGMSEGIVCVDVSELIEKGYINMKSVKDPKTAEEITGSVKIEYASNQYSYIYQENTCDINN